MSASPAQYVDSTRVRYECQSGSCVRYEGPANGALTSGPETVIPSVLNSDVFFFEPNSVNPNFVAVKLEIDVEGATNPDHARRRLRPA